MKKYLLAILAGTCIAGTAQAGEVVKTVYVNQAPVSDSSAYVALRGGANIAKVKAEGEKFDDTSFAVAAAVGSQIVDLKTGSLRGEVEYTYNDSIEDKDAEYDAQLLMANLYYDFDINSPVTPYVGAGVGVAFNDVDYMDRSDDGTSFAYSLSACVSVAVNPKVNVDLGYRYLNMTDFDATIAGQDIKVKPYSHQILAGVRVAL